MKNRYGDVEVGAGHQQGRLPGRAPHHGGWSGPGEHATAGRGGRPAAQGARQQHRGHQAAAVATAGEGRAVVEERREEVKQPGCGRAKCALTPAKEVS